MQSINDESKVMNIHMKLQFSQMSLLCQNNFLLFWLLSSPVYPLHLVFESPSGPEPMEHIHMKNDIKLLTSRHVNKQLHVF